MYELFKMTYNIKIMVGLHCMPYTSDKIGHKGGLLAAELYKYNIDNLPLNHVNIFTRVGPCASAVLMLFVVVFFFQ